MARRAATSTLEGEEEVKKTPLEVEMDKIEKDYGKGTIITASQGREKVDVISTGSIKLDLATGIGGAPQGKVLELMGWESSGKSTIAQNLIANCQRKGLKALLIDGENSFDATYAKALGVDVDSLLIEQLDEGGGERCYNVADRLIRTKGLGIAIIDSQTSLLPKKVLEGEVGDSAIGLHARMMSQCVPKLVNAAGIGNCLVVFISQFREKIGVMFGSPETTNGGNALKFYSHMRIEVRKTVLREGAKGEGGEAYANETRCKIIKNKLAVPFKEAKFNINYGIGIDNTKEILDLAIDLGLIKMAGSWLSWIMNGEEVKVQGEDAVYNLLQDNLEFRIALEAQVMEKLKP